jgi:hypothetical protein
LRDSVAFFFAALSLSLEATAGFSPFFFSSPFVSSPAFASPSLGASSVAALSFLSSAFFGFFFAPGAAGG